MDNKKVGKLIAKLRNEKGLTQQKLGDKVGVGFRAVSKWERGLTMPDIGIINELSQILGISSDELLSGELKEKEPEKLENENIEEQKPKNKIPLKIKISISIIISIILIFISVLVYYKNKTYVYIIQSTSEEYYIKGQATFKGNELSMIVNQLHFKNQEFSSTIIKNYEYYIYSNDELLFGYSFLENGSRIEKTTSIKEFCKTFRMNYVGESEVKRAEMVKNNIKIIFNFTDVNNQTIIKEIEFSLYEKINNK